MIPIHKSEPRAALSSAQSDSFPADLSAIGFSDVPLVVDSHPSRQCGEMVWQPGNTGSVANGPRRNAKVLLRHETLEYVAGKLLRCQKHKKSRRSKCFRCCSLAAIIRPLTKARQAQRNSAYRAWNHIAERYSDSKKQPCRSQQTTEQISSSTSQSPTSKHQSNSIHRSASSRTKPFPMRMPPWFLFLWTSMSTILTRKQHTSHLSR